MRTQLPLALLAATLACSLATAPAHARARVFVASYGNDANPCTFGSPCKTFQQAVNVVDAGGEVTAIDSAGFQPVLISKSVSIVGPSGIEAGVVATAGVAIHVTAATTDTVSLRGLTLDGGGAASYGIQVDSVGQLEVIGCVVRNFSNTGIFIGPSVNSTQTLSFIISDTLVSKNANYGILVEGLLAQTINGTIERVRAIHNQDGIYVYGAAMSGGALNVAISDSVASNNTNGIIYQTNTIRTVGSVQNSTIAGNSDVGLDVISTNVAKTAYVGVQSSTISGNFIGLFIHDGGTILLSRSMFAQNTFDFQESCSSICLGDVLSTGDNGEASSANLSLTNVPYH
jgi:hypothetical protein